MRYSILISLAALALSGCAHHVGFHSSHLGFDTTPHYAQPSAIPCYGKGPLHYTTYYGSDAKWHYFESHHDLKLKRYMVPRGRCRDGDRSSRSAKGSCMWSGRKAGNCGLHNDKTTGRAFTSG